MCYVWSFQTELQFCSINFYCWGNCSMGVVICPWSPRRLGENKIGKNPVFLSKSLVFNLLEPVAVYY